MRSDHRNRTGLSANRAKTSAMVRATIGFAVGVAAGVTGSALAQTPAFELIEPSPGYTATWVSDIADNGTVVGWSFTGTVPGFGQTYRYTPGGARTEYGIGDFPRISGDGHVVSVDSVGSNFDVVLYRDDGTQHTIPPVIINGQSRRGRMTHLNRDGSIAMLYYRSTGNEFESFRWTLNGNTTTLPPFPGGSSFNQTTGLSSDGRIAVGAWAPNSSFPDAPWAWTDGGSTLTPLLDPNGIPITFGRATAISGDGRSIYVNGFIIRDGLPIAWDHGSSFVGIAASDASFDGNVLVGELGAANGGGSWIWTQETGAIRAEAFLQMHGVSITAPYGISRLMVSNDGLHFAGLASAAGVDARGFVATIPSPGIVSSLILVGIGATARRRRWRRNAASTRRSGFCFAALAGTALLGCPALAQTPAFELIEPSVGFAKTQVYDIADDGTVVAMSYNDTAATYSPIIRYSPGGARFELPVGNSPRISGDGMVVGYNAQTTLEVMLHSVTDGTERVVPPVLFDGALRLGTLRNINRDGSLAMLSTGSTVSRTVCYRWTLDGNTATLPPFPGGSTFNSVTGLSSDGRIAVGNWAPNFTQTNRPWVWEDGGPAIMTVLDPTGTPIQIGGVGTISGDGRTLFYVSDAGPGLRYVSRDGVVEPWVFGGPLAGANIFPQDSSFDGGVLVGSLGISDGGGSWIWTQATGAMRAEDFLSMHGVSIIAPYQISRLMVSNDGLHFAGLASAAGVDARGFVATIPSPGIVSSLILVGIGATAKRRRDSR
ncbi:MAG: hypothetical protein AB7Q00_00805 [Phycisphaerales bacterium]